MVVGSGGNAASGSTLGFSSTRDLGVGRGAALGIDADCVDGAFGLKS